MKYNVLKRINLISSHSSFINLLRLGNREDLKNLFAFSTVAKTKINSFNFIPILFFIFYFLISFLLTNHDLKEKCLKF